MLLKTASEPSEYKTIPAFVEIKAEEEDQGIVTHYISVFGVLDLGKDVCHPGSFTKTLQERKGQIRVLDCHQRRSILNALGVPLGLKEVPRDKLPAKVLERFPEATGGVEVRTQFLLDTPEGKGAFIRIKSGAVTEFSFAYDTLDEDFETLSDGKEIRNLRTIRLWEYGPVLFGMNPAAMVIGAKGIEGEPDEEKPAPDVTENTIRIRVKDPGSFQEGSFRTITIGEAAKGIKAVIGRLKGETSTTVQSYIFDKKKWTTKTATAWVKEHGKSKALSFTRTIEVVRGAFNLSYNPGDSYRYWVKEVFGEFLIAEVSGERTFFKVSYTTDDDTVEFAPRGEWVRGDYTFVERSKTEKDVDETQGNQGKLLEIEMEQVQMLLDIEAGPAT